MTSHERIVIPCITLWRPWSGWVAAGWKTIETRLHDRFAGLKGKRIAIHAALKWDADALGAARDYLKPWQIARTDDFYHAAGRVVCTAHVADTRWLTAADSPRAMIDCGGTRRFGLELADVRIVPASDEFRVTGRQGQFSVALPKELAA